MIKKEVQQEKKQGFSYRISIDNKRTEATLLEYFGDLGEAFILIILDLLQKEKKELLGLWVSAKRREKQNILDRLSIELTQEELSNWGFTVFEINDLYYIFKKKPLLNIVLTDSGYEIKFSKEEVATFDKTFGTDLLERSGYKLLPYSEEEIKETYNSELRRLENGYTKEI